MVVLCALRNKEIDKNIKQIEEERNKTNMKRIKNKQYWLSKMGRKRKLKRMLKCFIKHHIKQVNIIKNHFSAKPYISKETIINYGLELTYIISEEHNISVLDFNYGKPMICINIVIGKISLV